MSSNADIQKLLDYIDPTSLSYQEWVNVGMAIQYEGGNALDWDVWSRRDTRRYHPGECEQKWKSFNGSGSAKPVTGGTLYAMALQGGYKPDTGHELDWDDIITKDDVVIDKSWIESKELKAPDEWHPARQLITYLETLFDSTENVGYVTETWLKDDKYLPTKGCWDRTAGQLIEELSKCGDDIGSVLGDYNTAAGAWIRFNPLDGVGVKNENVTAYRYALVECDRLELGVQNAIIRELQLPVAVMVYSGSRSIHAIVKIDADDYSEYRKRVDYLYDVCRKNGLDVDTQNKNPSRLSRMPGVTRGENKQYIIDVNIGQPSYNAWKEWIEGANDELPDPESLSGVWDNLPDLAPALIDGVLRQGHKMLIAGPSKAGKSFALIEMCVAIAEGKTWLGLQCAQGKVMYVNLELDRASCLHRFKDVYTALAIPPEHLSNIEIWNLRGYSSPMDKLAPKLIRRATKKGFIAVIIDPIYKVITGDENSADQMANFCNQFDKVCTSLGCAVIYCHHHSKGSQGGKRSMDRPSGSGVFARDPDALLDMIELEVPQNFYTKARERNVTEICTRWLTRWNKLNGMRDTDWLNPDTIISRCEELLPENTFKLLSSELFEADKMQKSKTAWRVSGTLREFPKFTPINTWFDYPIHRVDDNLAKLKEDGEISYGSGNGWSKKKPEPKDKKKESEAMLNEAYDECAASGEVTVKSLAEYFTLSEQAVRDRIDKSEKFTRENGKVRRVSKVSNDTDTDT